jgi:hypothetical protein
VVPACSPNRRVERVRRNRLFTSFAAIGCAVVLTAGAMSQFGPLREAGPRPAHAGSNVNVLTQHNDNQRTGQNLNETTLNTSNVNVASFGKLFTRAADGQLYAQPLYVSNLAIPGKGTHNVVFVATTHNTVYAFDADDPAQGTPLWSVNLGPSIPVPDACFGYRYGPLHDIHIEVGIISTPVIDAGTGTMYVVAATKDGVSTSPNCDPTVYHHTLHALDITTGLEKLGGPVRINATVAGTGPDSAGGMISLNNMQQQQRPAITLANGKIYIAFGSYADTDNYHGWILSYDPTTLAQNGAWTNEPDVATDPTNQPQPYEGGIWQAGQGPQVDGSGNLYVSIGNGDFNGDTGGHDYGDSMVKLSPTLTVSDWFTPYNVANLNRYDTDLGCSGLLLIPGTNYLIGGGKQGVLYLVNTANMGHFNAAGDTQIPQSFQATVGHIHGAPIYWNGPNGPSIYVWSELDYLKMFHFNGTSVNTTPVTSPFKVPNGMPGGFLSLSANGSTAGSGIIWASHPLSGDANTATVPGMLEAYDASDVTRQLWTSEQNSARDGVGNFAKFAPPTVANGKVYLGTFSNQLNVYGLLNPPATNTPTNTPVGPTYTATNTPTVTPTSTPTIPLPSPWVDADIGAPGVAGSATYSAGAFTVKGGGGDIWNTADQFNYVSQPWSGDSRIVARVASQSNSNAWAKAGAMFRETLGAGSTFVDMVITPGNGAAFQYRPTTSASAVHVAGPVVTAPYWVRLVRQGNIFTGSISMDGITWTSVGSATVPMAANIYVGLPVTAHDNGLLSTAVFDNVSVSTLSQPTPTATNTPTTTNTATATQMTTSTATATPTNTPMPPTSTSTPTPTGGPTLSGLSATTSGPVNLTTLGTADWAHWGLTTTTSFDHKAGVNAQIPTYTLTNGGTVGRAGLYTNYYTWSDGTPTASASTRTGLYLGGAGHGFQLVLPADNLTMRTLKLYLGLNKVQAKLTATLSDGSAAPFTDTVDNPTGITYRTYTLTYKAGSAGQVLTVTWVLQTDHGGGSVQLHAAALS